MGRNEDHFERRRDQLVSWIEHRWAEETPPPRFLGVARSDEGLLFRFEPPAKTVKLAIRADAFNAVEKDPVGGAQKVLKDAQWRTMIADASRDGTSLELWENGLGPPLPR